MTRSNHDLFIPYDTGSPHDSLMTHISGLGRLARFDFERCAVEVDAIKRMIGGRRKSARFIHDECAEGLKDLEENGASVEELDDAFAHEEAMNQYDEGGAVITMSSYERTVDLKKIAVGNPRLHLLGLRKVTAK